MGSSAILGISFSGTTIPSGYGLLTNLDISYSQASEACLDNIIVSDPSAQAMDFEGGGCVQLPCGDEDGDLICDHADDCFGVVDECGVCAGDGIADGACDCDGTLPDCEGICGGDAVVDECGVCGGEGIADGACDCDGNVEDCAGVCGGDAVVDDCGVCGLSLIHI